MFELFVARRYLRAKRKQVVISVITVISVIGVAAGVMAMVIALAINTGFSSTLQKNLLGATAHVMIQEKEPGEGILGWEQIAARLRQLPYVVSSAPGLYEPSYIRGPVRSTGAIVKGVSVDSLPDALKPPQLKSGSIDGLRDPGVLPGIVLGSRLADSIGAVLNKQVTLMIPEGELTPFGPRPTFKRFVVSGIFETGFYDVDNNWAYTSLSAAQKAFGLDDVVNSIDLRLGDIYKSPDVAREAEAIIGPKLAALTWQEQNRPILSALRSERIVTVITIGLIQIVAALNILIALVMMVMEKHRDIAILMSMGARAKQIRNIFIYEGVLIGSVGTAIGLVVGYTLCYFANLYRWIPLDEQVYSLAYVPFDARWIDGVWIAAAALAVSVVATLYPARSATRILPVESLRYE
ncbi:MAG TPA: ABC transporter permease [Bryobacteraceae bacterium]|nr:ABC transporter permease [Bryobacteraceae bacterium]